jgi:hypothetical protein
MLCMHACMCMGGGLDERAVRELVCMYIERHTHVQDR